MRDKLVKDFLEADNVDKLIVKKQLHVEDGVTILRELIRYILDDIRVLDENTYKKLVEAHNKLTVSYTEKKNQIKTSYETDDDIDDRNLKLLLNTEDHELLHAKLMLIQETAYGKGWFD